MSAPERPTSDSFTVYTNTQAGEGKEKLPYTVDTLNRFRLISGEMFRDVTLPKSFKNISFLIEEAGFGALEFKLVASEALPIEIKRVFYDLFRDNDISRFLDKLTSVRGSGKSKVKISFPVNEGRLDHSNITYTIQR